MTNKIGILIFKKESVRNFDILFGIDGGGGL